MTYYVNRPQTNLEKEIDNTITKLVLPTMDELSSRLDELKYKKQELKIEIRNIMMQKQALITKRNRVTKLKNIYDNQLNGDFSNKKLCTECLNTYINIIDKKETDYIKKKDDYYELKLRKKQLEFNKLLLDIVKQNSLNEQKKLIEKKKSKKSLISSIPKQQSQQSLKSMSSMENLKNSKKSFKNGRRASKGQKSESISKKNSIRSKGNYSEEDISEYVSKLIQNYSSKKDGVKTTNSINSTSFAEGLNKMKELNKETKSIENNVKEILENIRNSCELNEDFSGI